MASGTSNDYSGHFRNYGGQQLNGVKIEGDINFFHSDAGKSTIENHLVSSLI